MKVLVVDDDTVTRRVVARMVTGLGHDCITAATGRAAWERLESEGDFDVVITDRIMPDGDGLGLCRRIRAADQSGGYTYVVVMSGLGADGDAREGMLAGADDYLAKPLRGAQVELRLIAGARVAALHQQLAFLTNDLREAARRDPLTGLGNRLQLTEDLATLADRARRYGHRYSLALLDIDHFKAYNDRYGHQAGDATLTAVADVLASGRAGDSAYRYGGEEFLCIFPEQSGKGALVAARRTLQKVRDLGIPHEGSSLGVLTVSAGVAELTAAEPDVKQALRRADEALYRAKAAGRDQAILDAPRAHVGVPGS